MILIFGGAHQGKREFVAKKYGYDIDDMYDCEKTGLIGFDKPVIINLEAYVLAAINRGENPVSYIAANRGELSDKIVIVTDIGSGIVPLAKEQRLWRDNVGKVLQILSREARDVFRIFCGLGERLK